MRLFLAAFAISLLGGSAIADSRLPPNQPGGATSMGTLDLVKSSSIPNGTFLPCIGYKAKIRFGDRHFDKQFYRFKLDFPNSRLLVKMFESPNTSLYFILYDKNASKIAEYRGEDHEIIDNGELSAGEYFVSVNSSSNNARLPDGTNEATVIFRAEPVGIGRPVEQGTVSLGTLSQGQSIAHTGSVMIKQGRTIEFVPMAPNRECPLASGANASVIDLQNAYTIQAPAGRINVGVSINSRQNWQSFKIQYLRTGNIGSQWISIENGQVDHPGGQLAVRVGDVSPISITPPQDAYVDYALKISYAGPTQPPGGSNPLVIDLGPPPTPPQVIITIPQSR